MESPLADTLVQDDAAVAKAVALSTAAETPPSTAPGYQVLRRLGAGKFGSVWLAREQNTGKHVAIKFYSNRRGVDWSLLSREVEKLAVLYTSRNIVRLVAVGWDHDPPYYVMEYLPSGSLAQKLEQGPLSVADAVQMATGIARGLVHAHGSGILHCDLKPANVLLDQDGEPRLCDFGQSRLAEERIPSLGTLFYMAPEQADLTAVPDARWDVYALGALLYQMLCGQPPYRTDTTDLALQRAESLDERLQRYQQVVAQGPRPTAHRRVSGVDGLLADIIDRCLAIDPARRFANAQAVLDKLVARERYRARRPLMLLGLVLPVVLILALAPFALDALHTATSTSRSNLIQRALESDVLSANLLADGIERELEHRLHELEAMAEDEDVRSAILEYATSPLEQRRPLAELLQERVDQIDRRRQKNRRAGDASWFLQDANGIQRWRSPESSKTMDQSYAYRVYFHGLDADYPKDQVPTDVMPIQRPHISTAYRSSTTGEFVVALSVPVFEHAANHKDGQVIAVLSRTLLLADLLKDYEKGLQSQGNPQGRKLALVDRRTWSLLAHRWMSEANLKQIDDPAKELRLNDDLIEHLISENGAASDRVSNYHDPVATFAEQEYGGLWLAAFCPIGDTHWIAAVQEPRGSVEHPVDTLRERLMWTGAGGMMLVSVLVAGVWWLLLVRMSDARPRWWPPRVTQRRTESSLTA